MFTRTRDKSQGKIKTKQHTMHHRQTEKGRYTDLAPILLVIPVVVGGGGGGDRVVRLSHWRHLHVGAGRCWVADHGRRTTLTASWCFTRKGWEEEEEKSTSSLGWQWYNFLSVFWEIPYNQSSEKETNHLIDVLWGPSSPKNISWSLLFRDTRVL